MSFNVTSESSGQLFCFYLDGNLCEGIRHRNRIYTLVKTLNISDHHGMRDICEELRRNNRACLITRSHHRYRVWTDVRSTATLTAQTTTSIPSEEAAVTRIL